MAEREKNPGAVLEASPALPEGLWEQLLLLWVWCACSE